MSLVFLLFVCFLIKEGLAIDHHSISGRILWIYLVLNIFIWKTFIIILKSFVLGLFMLLTSWFNFGGLAESQNSFIYFKFSSLTKFKFLKNFYVIFWISLVSSSLFVSHFVNLGVLFLLANWDKGLSILFHLLKELAFRMIYSLNYFLCFYLIDSHSSIFIYCHRLVWVCLFLVFQGFEFYHQAIYLCSFCFFLMYAFRAMNFPHRTFNIS